MISSEFRYRTVGRAEGCWIRMVLQDFRQEVDAHAVDRADPHLAGHLVRQPLEGLMGARGPCPGSPGRAGTGPGPPRWG